MPRLGTRTDPVAELATAAAVEFQIETAAGTLWAAAAILLVVAGSLLVVAGNAAGSVRPDSAPEGQAVVQFEGYRSTAVATELRQIQ